MRRGVAAWIAVAALLVARGASADAGYPDALRADLSLSYTPGCDLCHQAAAAPVGPADTPFGQSMVARGLVGGDAASMTGALDRMRADHVDSDGDGAEDLDELSWGGDPNHPDLPVGGSVPVARYGCAWSSPPPDAARVWPAIVALACLGARAASRRRRRNARAEA